MKSWIIGALAGILLGAAGAYGYLSNRYEADQKIALQQIEELKMGAAQDQKELETNRERLKLAEEQNRQLTSRSSPSVVAESSAATESQTPQAVATRDRTAEMRAFSEKMVKRGVDRWTASLKLTPDQVFRLNQILQSKTQNGQPGNFWNGGNMQNELAQVLTPQQKTEYDRVQARENQARMELRAQTQLSQVQSMFDLTESQKDQIFQKFAGLEQSVPAATSTVGGGNGGNNNGNRNQLRQNQVQKRFEALQGILTPEQLQQYKQSQEPIPGINMPGR